MEIVRIYGWVPHRANYNFPPLVDVLRVCFVIALNLSASTVSTCL